MADGAGGGMADVNGGMTGETSRLESSAGEEYTAAQSDVLAVVERLEETQSSSFFFVFKL
jgi:hypothetical protein